MQPIVRPDQRARAEIQRLDDGGSPPRRTSSASAWPTARRSTALLPELRGVPGGGRRRVGMRHFDVQLIGGMCSTRGPSPRWPTGEGRRWWPRCPAISTPLPARASNIVTVNDYLAKRDAQ